MLAPPHGAYISVVFAVFGRAFRLGETHGNEIFRIWSRRNARNASIPHRGFPAALVPIRSIDSMESMESMESVTPWIP